MPKLILLLLTIFSSLYAVDATEAQMDDIYFEALMFAGIFGTMGVISFVISKRHAKEYHVKTAPEVKKTKDKKQERLKELHTMYKEKALTFEEFKILEKHL